MKLKTFGLMLFFLALAAIAVIAIFWLLEIATRPDYVVRPGYYTEVGR